VTTTALLFNGLSTVYANPINIDQNGATVASGPVWTGTWDGGIKNPGNVNSALGDISPNIASSGPRIITHTTPGTSTASNARPMYAISGVLTVPAVPTTPAPGSIWLIAIGLGAIARSISTARGLAGAR